MVNVNDDGLTYYNYPKPVPISCYYSEIDRYIKDVSNVDDVIAIYSMGTIKCPGISDIDLIVVTKDNVKNSHRLSVFNKKYDNNLFIHDVIVISERVFKYLHYIFYASNLRKLWKRPNSGDLVVHKVPKREQALSIVLDFTEARLFEFQLLFRTRQVSVRQWLTRIESFRHTTKLIAVLLGSDNRYRYKQVLADLAEIREMWSKEGRFELNFFRMLLLKTANAFLDILTDIADVPELAGSFPIFKSRIVIHNKIITFSKNISYHAAFKEIRIPFKNRRIYAFVELPNYYLSHLSGYYQKTNKGHHLDSLKKSKKSLPSSRYRDFQEKRIYAVNKHWEFLKRNRINFSMTGYVCFKPKYDLHSTVRFFDYLMIKTLFRNQ